MDNCYNCEIHDICMRWRKPTLYGVKKELGCDRHFKRSVDSVIVVRCGECRFVDTKECPMSGSAGRVSASDFCSYGERKDNENQSKNICGAK